MLRDSYSPRNKYRREQDRRPTGGMVQQWSDMYKNYMGDMAQMWQEALSPLTEMIAPGASSTRPGAKRRGYSRHEHGRHRHRHPHHHHHHDCHYHDCRDNCSDDYCHCICCIGDADLAIYAHLGERRVVPIEIENSRRREREIRLELSAWSSRGGRRTNIGGQIIPPAEFTLAPCERREVLIVVNALSDDANATFGTAVRDVEGQDGEEKQSALNEREQREQRQRTPDVDECEVYYADLRVEGCDIRPVRLALVLLPRDCDPYEIDCRCGCC